MRDDVPLAVQQVNEPRWEAYYAVVYAVSVAIVEAGPLTTTGRIAASAALAAMVPWYLLVGRPLTRLDETQWERTARTLRGPVYLTVLIALFAVVMSQNTNAWFVAFALSPMCFHVTSVRRAMVFAALLNTIAAVIFVVRNPGPVEALVAVGIVAFGVAFSVVYSRWTMRVFEQSVERAALIRQLESTRKELAEAHHEAGVLAERHRLAGEIHDTLAQGFTSIVTLVQAATAALGEQNPARGHLELALKTARDNLAEARTLVAALSPDQLAEGNLGDALRRAAESAGAEAGLQARSEVTGTRRQLPTSTEVVLLRVCQEALANVRKHAAARQVDVGLCYAPGVVRLTVADDGRGFDAGTVNGGYGLRGMRERVRQAGGTIEVTTAPGAGTVVRAEVPG